jgi:hypothetical protein
MLLTLLNRKQKLKFLDLALYMVVVDGEPSEQEQRLLNMMLAEVGDNILAEYHFELSLDLEATIQFFDVLASNIRRIVYYNLVKIALSENFYNTTEHEFLEMIRERFHIHDDIKSDIIKTVYQEKDIREQLLKVVNQ